MKPFFNVVKLAEYRVTEDIKYTFLRAGDEYTAYLVQSFGKEYILMGISTLDPLYFDTNLSFGLIVRKDLPPWQSGTRRETECA